MIAYKALRSTFREAWKEAKQNEKRQLKQLRSERSRLWWEGIRDVPSTKMGFGLTKHRRKGPCRFLSRQRTPEVLVLVVASKTSRV